MHFYKKRLILSKLLGVAFFMSVILTGSTYRYELYTPKVSGKILFTPINESSGLVKSNFSDSIIWTHNDSGDKARIFAIRPDGTVVSPTDSMTNYSGIEVTSAMNIDWEDIAVYRDVNLIIGDIGNNCNCRKDLSLYIVTEPDPSKDIATAAATRYRFRYPDQKSRSLLKGKKNFDAEALFTSDSNIYILTKHHSGKSTTLYRFDTLDSAIENVVTKIADFPIGGMVTAADATPDGTLLAVLTYNNIWLFKKPSDSDNYFGGSCSSLDLSFWKVNQCESIAFLNSDTLLLGNEQRILFTIPVKDFSF